jgi:hypothetical protein
MAQMSRQELLQTASQFAGALMRENAPNEDVIEALLDEGLELKDAEFIVQHLLKIRAENIRRDAQLQIGKGIMICLVFFILTMLVNTLWNGVGYLVLLIGIGLGIKQVRHGLEEMKQANRIQSSFSSHQTQ